jgi:RNA polymerase sigma-70 factor (TIGR02943 family)
MQDIKDTSSSASIIKSWVELYSDSMYSWAFYKTSSKETAEDLVQETFMAAIQAFEKFERKSNPKTWLFAILNNKITDHYRRQIKNPTLSERQQSETGEHSLFDHLFDSERQWRKEERPKPWQDESENILDNAEFNKVLQNCLGKLPNTWFSAVQLKYFEEKRGELICQELQITPSNFWQILHRTKLQLRKCLELNWFKT